MVRRSKQKDNFSSRFIYYLAAFWSISSALYIAAITFVVIPKGNERIVDTILGFLLGTIISTLVNYFYGTSSSSLTKNEMLLESKRIDPS